MGAFNRLLTQVECSSCHQTARRRFQFKYGERWQYDYSIGDRLVWGGGDNDTGKPEVAGGSREHDSASIGSHPTGLMHREPSGRERRS